MNRKPTFGFLYKVAETFDVVIKWDTENKIVNFYKNESYGNDRDCLLNMVNI